jgi:hypothetical protein
MSDARRLTFYGYVDRPYENVRHLLRSRPDEVLQRATNAASDRAGALLARLRLEGLGMELGVEVRVEVARRPDEPTEGGLPPVTHLGLSWRAANAAGLFPSMTADLALSPMTSVETRVEFKGTYRPPFAAAGKAFDAALGHRIAEATVHRFVQDLIDQIRIELPPAA